MVVWAVGEGVGGASVGEISKELLGGLDLKYVMRNTRCRGIQLAGLGYLAGWGPALLLKHEGQGYLAGQSW